MRRIFYLWTILTLTALTAHSEEIAGKVEGNLAVTSSGAANYTIPIHLIPGPNEYAPTLTLNYNSQGGNGLAGFGWNLTGTSSITIGPRCVHFDERAQGLQKGPDNAYFLDGMRLLLVSGTNGRKGAVYRTESEQYSIIQIDSVLAETPASFILQAKDGSTYKYGSHSGRVAYTPNAAYEWALDYAEDRLGNYINYSYRRDGAAIYLTAIRYGKNRNNPNMDEYAVELTYEPRADGIPVRRFDTTTLFRKRLKEINCKRGGVSYRRYTLQYEDHLYSHLVSVKEHGLNFTSFPATTLTWEKQPEYVTDDILPAVERTNDRNITGPYYSAADVDNDGISELIGIYNCKSGQNPYWAAAVWKQSKETGKFHIQNIYYTQSGISIKGFTSAWQKGGTMAHASNRQENSIILPYFSDTFGDRVMVFNCPKEGIRLTYPMRSQAYNPCHTIIDMDKDGMDDIVLVENAQLSGSYPATIIRFNLSKGKMTHKDFSMNLDAEPTQIKPADYDGDGMTDLLVCTKKSFYIYWNQGGQFSDKHRYHGHSFSSCEVLETGDLNADGLADLIVKKSNSTVWHCAMGQGKRTEPFSFSHILPLEGFSALSCQFVFMQDANGDGKSDLIVGLKSNNYGHILTLLSQGNTLKLAEHHVYPPEAPFPSSQEITLGDFDGDGIPELMYYGGKPNTHAASQTATWHLLKPRGHTAATNRITSITDGWGTTHRITYGRLTERDIYHQSSPARFPFLNLRAPLSVVARIEHASAADTLWTAHTYGDALYHWQGKGFLGFKSATTLESTGVRRVLQNELDTAHCFLYPSIEQIYAPNHSLWRTNTYRYGIEPLGKKAYLIRWQEKSEKDEINSHYITNSISHNNDFSSMYVIKRENSYQSSSKITCWKSSLPGVHIKGLPLIIETEKSGGDMDQTEETERIEYTRDDRNGLPLSRKRYSNGTLLSTEHYTYDTEGKLTSHTLTRGSSTTALTTTYTYTPKGWLSEEKDPLERRTSYVYTFPGMLTQSTNYRGVATRYTYDGMLRLTDTDSPILHTQRSIEWAHYGTAVTKVVENASGQPTTITYYDGFGRKMAEAGQRFNGEYLFTDYQYLSNGEIGFVSLPHAGEAVSSTGTRNTFDAYNRIIRQTDSQGKTSTWSYKPYIVTSTVDGITRRKLYLKHNMLRGVYDNSGDVEFSFDPSQRVRSIYRHPWETTIEYDDFGHVTRTTDMLGVTRSYTYDQDGYPKSATQGGSALHTTYDPYGRLFSQIFHDEGVEDTKTSYFYNIHNDLILSHSKNHIYSWKYDPYGRIQEERRTIKTPEGSEERMTCTYAYNAEGQIQSKKTQLGSGGRTLVESYTYANGWCTEILLDGTSVWRLQEEDERGNTRRALNHLDSLKYEYDTYGQLLTKRVSGKNTLSLNYRYDAKTGNLIQANKDKFTYDEFNRLAGWRGFTYKYDGEGNITSMPLLGEMEYDGFRLSSVSTKHQLGVSQNQWDLTYLRSISRPNSIHENGKRVEFAYDGDKQRVWMKSYTLFKHTGTRYYVSDNYEIDHVIGKHKRHYYYVGGSPYTAKAVALLEDTVSTLYQIYRDRMGSIVLYGAENDRQRIHYSPWGTRLISENWNIPHPPNFSANLKFIRTYTGHEQLPYFGLLNANARLYNPYMGRFLSPDPLLATSGMPLDFNPYIYARNNPLSYVDLNGEFPVFLVWAAVGGVINIATNWNHIHSFGDGLLYFGVGAAAGAVGSFAGSLMAGSIASTGFIGGMKIGIVGGASSGLLLGGGNAAISGEKILPAMGMGAISGGVVGGLLGGITGGIQALRQKANFWYGRPKQPFATETPLRNATDAELDAISEPGTRQRISPHEKGEIGVEAARKQLEAEGYEIVKTEIHYTQQGVNGRIDILAKKDGDYLMVEVKNGLHTRFTPNQKILYPRLRLGEPFQFYGPKANYLNLPIGKPVTNYKFREMFYNLDK